MTHPVSLSSLWRESSITQHLSSEIEIYDLLGEGGFASIYRAKIRDRDVAARCISYETIQQHRDLEDRIARVLRPPTTAQKTEYLVMPTAFALDERQSRVIMILPLFEQRLDTSAEIIRNHPGMDDREKGSQLFELIFESGKGLAIAHRLGLCHRDVKPSNFLTKEEKGKTIVALSDFDYMGFDARGATTLTQNLIEEGGRVATLAYCHPLMLTDPLALLKRGGFAVDLYGFGWTMADILFGVPPGDAIYQTILRTRSTFRSAENLESSFDRYGLQGLERVFIRLTDPDPTFTRTYQSMREVYADLRMIRSGNGESLREKKRSTLSLRRSWTARHGDVALTRQQKRRSTIITAGIAAGILSGMIGAQTVAYWRSPIPALSNIASSSSIPSEKDAHAMIQSIARDYKNRFGVVERKDQFPIGCYPTVSGIAWTSNASQFSGEFLGDLKTLYSLTGDPFFARQYAHFVEKMTFEPMSSETAVSEWTGYIPGRFTAAINAGAIASGAGVTLDVSVLERPVLAGRIILDAWYDPQRGVLRPPGNQAREDTVLDARSIYWILPLLAELPHHYRPQEFLDKGIGSFREWPLLRGRAAGNQPSHRAHAWTVREYTETLLNISETAYNTLCDPGTGVLYPKARITDHSVERMTRTDGAISFAEHAGIIFGVAQAISTVDALLGETAIDEPVINEYRTCLMNEIPAGEWKPFAAAIGERLSSLHRRTIVYVENYARTLPTRQSAPLELVIDNGSPTRLPDLSGPQYIALAAQRLLSLETVDVSPTQTRFLRSIRDDSLITIYRPSNYYCRPGVLSLREQHPFSFIGKRGIYDRSVYGTLSGWSASLPALLSASKEIDGMKTEEKRKTRIEL